MTGTVQHGGTGLTRRTSDALVGHTGLTYWSETGPILVGSCAYPVRYTECMSPDKLHSFFSQTVHIGQIMTYWSETVFIRNKMTPRRSDRTTAT